jgi:hypothetical protein
MDTAHWLLLELIGMSGAPILIALLASALWWRSVGRPILFLFFAVLSLWGLAGFAWPVAQDLLNPSKLGPATYPSAQFNVLLAIDIFVLALGVPLLLALRKALRRA